jgi:peptide/nickel transport system ATP-binding protein
MSPQPLLKVENLKTHFTLSKPHPFAQPKTVFAVDGVSFEIERGKTFGLVGESGCGKSTTALSILRLVEPTAGSVILNGTDVYRLDRKALRQFRRHMQVVFQDPYSSMNPRSTAGELIKSPLKIMKIGTPEEQDKRVSDLLNLVGLRPEQRNLFPHQFSGGQRQRICVARALAPNPEFIVCDEPVSALDVAIQAQILNLLVRLQQELNLTYLFISHDMAVIQHICDDIAVMYLGKIVERTDRRTLFREAKHPYTRALFAAIPTIDPALQKTATKLKGDVPSPMSPPPGCRFHPRCPMAGDGCRREEPQLREVAPGHFVACHLV